MHLLFRCIDVRVDGENSDVVNKGLVSFCY